MGWDFITKFVPFSHNDYCVSTTASVVAGPADQHIPLQLRQASSRCLKFLPDLRFFHLRVVDGDLSSLGDEAAYESDCWRFASVGCVFLKSKAKYSNSLACKIIEHAAHDPLCETLLLVLVHIDDTTPIVCNLVQMQRFRKVDNVKDIFLEAAVVW